MTEPTLNIDSFNANVSYSDAKAKFRQIYNLIKMHKGTDPLNSDKGVDINTYYYQFADDSVLTDIENEITNQIATYTPYRTQTVRCFTRKSSDGNTVLCTMVSLIDEEIKLAVVTNGNASAFDLLVNK
jgi:hypothetical protein